MVCGPDGSEIKFYADHDFWMRQMAEAVGGTREPYQSATHEALRLQERDRAQRRITALELQNGRLQENLLRHLDMAANPMVFSETRLLGFDGPVKMGSFPMLPAIPGHSYDLSDIKPGQIISGPPSTIELIGPPPIDWMLVHEWAVFAVVTLFAVGYTLLRLT